MSNENPKPNNSPVSYQTSDQYAQLQGQEIIKPLSITKGEKKVTVNIHQDANGNFLRATDINTGKEIPIQTDKDGNLSIGNTLNKPKTSGTVNKPKTTRTSGSAGNNGNGTPTAVAPVRKTKTQLADDYNVQMAVINSDPSLVTLFNQAVAQQLTPAAFAAKLRNTDFYLQHGGKWADAQIKKLGDPGDWKDQMAEAKTLIEQTSVDLGMQLEPREVDALANSALHASAGVANSITSTWLNTHIATYGTITGKGGTTADTINSLKSSGAAYGIQHSDDWYINAAKSIVKKTATQEDFESQIKDLAKTKYAPFADQIDKGVTVQQIASPYINSMANILEVPSANIGLDDHTINRALTNLDDKGQPQAQPLWQFETNLRQDPRWATTKNANDTLSSLSNSILKTFGLVS